MSTAVSRTEAALPSAMLIDLDDTILDDTGGMFLCWESACKHFAGPSNLDEARLYAAITRFREWYWSDPDRHREGRHDLRAASAHIVEMALESMSVVDAILARAIADHFRDQRDELIAPFPGAIETLDTLRQAGVRLALLTNGSAVAQRHKIDRFDLTRHFDCILVEGELGFGKPDERVYRQALEALKVRPIESWMVGDNIEWDVATPQRLGIRGVWVNRSGAELPVSFASVVPHRVIKSFSELLG